MVERSTAVDDPLAAGLAAAARAEWDLAAREFARAAAADDPDAWAGLSRAAWWLGDAEQTLSARERAYRLYQASGDRRRAAHMALWLGGDHMDFHGDEARGRAWLRRARSLLQDEPECVEHGWVDVMEADVILNADGETTVAAALAEEGLRIARAHADVDLEVVALSMLGGARVALGEVAEGMRCLQESMALTVGGEFTDAAAPGWALCFNVTACADLGDFSQASRWCEVLHEFAASWRGRHFFGSCRLAYGGVLATGGQWSAAEEELVSAHDDFLATRPAMAAPSAVRLGQLRVRQGRTEEARALFEEAVPMPGAVVALGELDLASGDAEAAADAADRVLRQVGEYRVLEKLPALELAARARAAAGDHDGAAAAARRVGELAERLGTPYLRGRASAVLAETSVGAGAYDDARRSAEDAMDLFTKASAPFESAYAQLVLARALHGLGRGERAAAHERAARETLEKLGVRTPGHDEVSARELEVLRLVAQGHGDARVAELLFLSPHTVHRHVANIRTKLGVGSRAAAVGEATRLGLL